MSTKEQAHTEGPFSSEAEELAHKLGWRWSSAHDGYISEGHRNRPNATWPGWDSYEVAVDAEEALFWEGIETEEDMRAALAKAREAQS